MIKLFSELRRRNVFRVCGTYVVAAWFLVQTAFTLEGVMNLPEWFDGLVLAVAMLGFPIIAILAWAFELTPDGFKRTEVVSAEDSIATQTGKKLDVAIVIGLVLVAGLLLADRFKPAAPQFRLNSASVAVLPFENRSLQDADAFFADGIHDELLTTLSRINGLDVISRTSVMGYRGTDKRVPDIADELGVAAVLEGAVQRSGDRVRITVQLIDGTNDRHIWAESYDRPLSPENIFDIQGEITNVIASSLRGVLIAEKAPRQDIAENLVAYDAYIKARLLTQPGENNSDELRLAIESYDAALAADPDYAKAWAGKAYAQLALYWFHGRDAEIKAAGKASLDRAKELAPNALETHLADAFYLYWGESNYRAAEAIFDRALSVAPGNVEAIAGQAFLTRRLGNFETALTGLEKAHRLDPASFYLLPELALTHVFLGHFDEADAFIEKAKAMNPDSLQGHGFAAAIAQFRGDADAAFDAFTPLATYAPYTYVNYALTTRDENKIRAALAVWPETQRTTPGQKAEYALAHLRSADTISLQVSEREKHEATLRALYDPSAGWHDAPYEYPVLVAAILGEAKDIDRLANAHKSLEKNDAIQSMSDFSDLAEGYMRLDQPQRALDYFEKMVELTGPHILRVFENDTLYAPLRTTPRWAKLASSVG